MYEMTPFVACVFNSLEFQKINIQYFSIATRVVYVFRYKKQSEPHFSAIAVTTKRPETMIRRLFSIWTIPFYGELVNKASQKNK